MPIIDMKKVYLLGHQQEKEKVFNLLHQMGNLELLDMKNSRAWNDFEMLVEPDKPDDSISQIDDNLAKIRYCLDFFQRHFPIRKNFVQQFTGAKLDLSSGQYNEYIEQLEQVNVVYDSCRQAENELARIRNEETQCKNLIEELRPWCTLDLPLEEVKESAYFFLGFFQIDAKLYPSLCTSLVEQFPINYLEEVYSDNEFTCFLSGCLYTEKEAFQNLFKDNGVVTVEFSDLTGTAAQNIEMFEKELSILQEERLDILSGIEGLLENRPMLMAGYDYLDNEYSKYAAVLNLVRTDNSFLLEGWVPVPVYNDLETTMAQQCETVILAARNPEPGENVPVLLHNKGPVGAYEVVTKLYSTPKKNELDPTPYMAPFFFAFFGIILSDVGYGIILALISLFLVRKLKVGGMGKQLLNLLLLGGISSVLFGVLLGGYFGDLIKLPPLWFDPLEDPMRMLLYCFAIGFIHVYFGMALQAYRNFKSGQILSAIFDQGFWFIFLNGLVMLFLPELAAVGQWLTIAGAGGLILTQGRNQQGVIKKFMSGLLSLYNITGYLSDVLSYSRLLALGLATGVIASAINSMGGMISGSIIGTVIMVLVLFGGHLFNIVISTLGSYVHTSRLQYIEFFGKFFEGGGKTFQPFCIKNSYVEINEAINSD